MYYLVWAVGEKRSLGTWQTRNDGAANYCRWLGGNANLTLFGAASGPCLLFLVVISSGRKLQGIGERRIGG